MRPLRSSMATAPKLTNTLTAKAIFSVSSVAKLLANGALKACRCSQARPKPAPYSSTTTPCSTLRVRAEHAAMRAEIAQASGPVDAAAYDRFTGWLGHGATLLALAMSLFHLWAAWDIVPTTILRYVHVGFAMVLGFALFPVSRRFRNRVMPWDAALIAASAAIGAILLSVFTERRTPVWIGAPAIVAAWVVCGIGAGLLVVSAAS